MVNSELLKLKKIFNVIIFNESLLLLSKIIYVTKKKKKTKGSHIRHNIGNIKKI